MVAAKPQAATAFIHRSPEPSPRAPRRMIAQASAAVSAKSSKSRSPSVIMPASARNWKSITRSQYSRPKRMTGMACIRSVCRSARASNSSSSVPKPPGNATKRLRPQQEVELADGEIVELEAEFGRDIGVRLLLAGQADVQADRFGGHVVGAAIGRLHDARPAAGHDHVLALPPVLSHDGNQPAELPRRVVVAASLRAAARPGPRRAAGAGPPALRPVPVWPGPVGPGRPTARRSACCRRPPPSRGCYSAESRGPA